MWTVVCGRSSDALDLPYRTVGICWYKINARESSSSGTSDVAGAELAIASPSLCNEKLHPYSPRSGKICLYKDTGGYFLD